MDAKLKAKWVKALRSGKYKQARGALCRPSGAMCCIGVGALVAAKFKPEPNMATLHAAQALGLSEAQWGRLVNLNDYERRSFKKIADYIEKHL